MPSPTPQATSWFLQSPEQPHPVLSPCTEKECHFPNHRWQPQDPAWSPGVQSTARPENHPGGCTLGRAVALPTAGFSSAPRVWQWGIGFHQKSLAPRAIQKSTSSHVPLPLSPLGQESKKVPSLLETQALANGVSWPGTSGWLSFQSRLPHVLASSRAALQPHRQRVRGLTAGLGCLSSTPPPTEDSVFSRSWPQLRLSLLLTLPPSGHRSAHQCQALDAEVMEAD